MKRASSSSLPTANSSAKPTSIQVMLPKWVTDGAGLPISALSAEKSGDEWFLLIHAAGQYYSPKFLKFPARDIQINGQPLDRFLERIADML